MRGRGGDRKMKDKTGENDNILLPGMPDGGSALFVCQGGEI